LNLVIRKRSRARWARAFRLAVMTGEARLGYHISRLQREGVAYFPDFCVPSRTISRHITHPCGRIVIAGAAAASNLQWSRFEKQPGQGFPQKSLLGN